MFKKIRHSLACLVCKVKGHDFVELLQLKDHQITSVCLTCGLEVVAHIKPGSSHGH